METRYCLQCGKPFQVKPSSGQKLCSQKCNGLYQQGKPRPSMWGKPAFGKGLTKDTNESIRIRSFKHQKNVIDKDALQKLYVEENMSLQDIGARYNVSKHVIKRLVIEFGLLRKRDQLTKETLQKLYEDGMTVNEIGDLYNCSGSYIVTLLSDFQIQARKHNNQARIVPTKELLEELYCDQWLSYEAIGERLGVDFTTIPYWLKKFGIPHRTIWETRRGKNWQAPDPALICHLYTARRLSTIVIGKMFGVSSAYINQTLRDGGIKLRKQGYPNIEHYIASDGHKVRSGLELQVDEWLTRHQLTHTYSPPIPNSRKFGDFFVGDTFIEVWGVEQSDSYDKNTREKKALYQDQGLDLLSVYQTDFPELHVLDRLLT